MEKQQKKVVLSQAEYEVFQQLAAQHASLVDELRTAQQAREEAEERARKLNETNILLLKKLKEERAEFRRKLKQFILRRSERYPIKTPPPTDEQVEAVAQVLLKTPQEPPVQTDQKGTKPTPADKKKRNHPGRKPIPDHLPRVEVLLEPEEDVSGCVKIGEEITEELDLIPGFLYVRRFIRPKYARPDNMGVAIAPAPVRVIEKGIPGPMLIAFILISKYLDHLPLHRQLAIFRRCGIEINEVTFNGWTRQGITQLTAIYTAIRKKTLQADYLQADETTIRVMDPVKKGTTHLGYYWAYMDPLHRSVVFFYEKGRGGKYVREHLKNFRGHLQTDGYAAYDSLTEIEKAIIRLSCWAHARRKFFEAQEAEKELAEWFLQQIQLLYAIERFARLMKLSAQERLQLRGHAKPILEGIKAKMIDLAPQLPPKNPLAIAIRYTMNQWEELLVYTTDGRFEIDNNPVENSIRPIALGRKNYLFAGDHDAAQRAAIIYTIIASCKALDINPLEYIADVLDRVVVRQLSDIDDLLPWNWKPDKNP